MDLTEFTGAEFEQSVSEAFKAAAHRGLKNIPHIDYVPSLIAITDGALENNIPNLQPIYGADHEIFAFESLSRPIDNNGINHNIQKLADASYTLEESKWFDIITCFAGLENAAENNALPLTLNISVAAALDYKFFNKIEEKIHKLGIDPENIIFEILEQDIEDPNADTSHFNHLKKKGYRFALDDFAIGDNFNRLLEHFGEHVDYIKIDGKYVCGFLIENELSVADDEKCISGLNKILRNINAYYEPMNHRPKLIAEHANTPDDIALLSENGFSYFQGRDLRNTLKASETCQYSLHV